MPDLSRIIDYTSAPLVQWEPAIGEAVSEGKAQEDAIIYPAIAAELNRAGANFITGIIADEARMETYMTEHVPTIVRATHLTLKGAFEAAALKNGVNASRVLVTIERDDVEKNSQDAVVMNMILGCVATPKDHDNIKALVGLAASRLKSGGELVIVRPNPEGGKFDTYACLTPKKELKAGQDYDFIVKGLEDIGAMKNLYTPDAFMEGILNKFNFAMQPTQKIGGEKAPFLLNVCKYNPPPRPKPSGDGTIWGFVRSLITPN